MKQLIYRTIKKSDYPTIKALINSAWHFERFATHERIREDILEIYLRNCLIEQTFNTVVEDEGKVIGILLGRSEKAYKKYKVNPHTLPIMYRIIKFCFSEQARQATKGYKNFSKAYKDLMADRAQLFDGELVLFIVNEAYRGQGIGKQLTQMFFEYMKQTDTNCIYLYTDTACNYAFYDQQGFKRIDERWIEVENLEGKEKMGVYLYSYDLS
ncbi:MAG: GNAT family N-acetyltransferase [Cellulosilyticaceae bacterium]